MAENNDFSAFLAGVFVGGVAGALAALLMAPQSGEEVRTLLKEKGIEIKDRASVSAEEALRRAEEARRKAEEALAEARRKAEEAAKAAQEQAITLQKRGKEAAEEVTRRVKKSEAPAEGESASEDEAEAAA